MNAKNFAACLAPHRRSLSACITALILAGFLPFPVRGVTVDEFGYGSMRVNNRVPLGTRPLLLIVANYDGPPPLTNHNWDSLIFGVNTTSLSEYYRENSNGRFSWTRAGLFNVNFTQAERMTFNTRNQIIEQAVYRAGIDFANFDANRDGTVTGDELSILIIHNLFDGGGQTGPARFAVFSPSSVPFPFISLDLSASGVAHKDSLMTFCHEICHTLGALDMYGNDEGLHGSITLMSGTVVTNSSRTSWHLDPWHKMVLGWSEPRIVSLRGSDSAILPAAQLRRADGPVLLFDPSRGTAEFYLLEYRTPTTPSARGGYDTNVASQGLLVWHVWQNPNHTPVLASMHSTLPYPSQNAWQYCKKCTGMFYGPNRANSRCPTGGPHEVVTASTYSMVMTSGDPQQPGQPEWRWCWKCQSMFFGGNASPTRCSADNGLHDGSFSANYTLRFNGQIPRGAQTNWYWCLKCQGLYFNTNANPAITAAGVCPVSAQHDGSQSSLYSMHTDIWSVLSESAPPNNFLTGSTAWGVGTTTSNSVWFTDRSHVRVRYQPKRYLNGGDELLVEWTSELSPPAFSGGTWVDYNWFPFPLNDGTFSLPFTSLVDAVNRSPFYSRILIKPGFGAETIRITQSVFLEAPLGPVTIGRSGP